MNVPDVSVILPTYNRSRTLERAIGSVLAQSYRNLELIVVDDGSDEDIRPVLSRFDDDRLRYVRRECNGGVAAARNTGVQAARGEWLAFQDSDDEWLLDKLALQVAALKEGEAGQPLMVIAGLLRTGGRVRWYPMEPQRSRGIATLEDVMERPIAYTQSWLVKREHIVEAGGFDERLRIWDDWELLLRLAQRVRIRLLPTPCVISEQEQDSISRDRSRFIHDMALMLEKHTSLLAHHKEQLTTLRYVQARLLASDGRLAEARQVLLRTIRQHPRRGKPWMLLGASLLGRSFVQRSLRQAEAGGTA